MKLTKKLPFNAEAQFKTSLLEVLSGPAENSTANNRLYTMATATAGPGAAYLQQKRGSVFQKNVEMHTVCDFVPPVFAKSEQNTDAIMNLLKDIYLTSSLEHKDRKTLADAMQLEKFKKGEVITRFGDIGDKYYILSKGQVKVKVFEPNANPFDPKLESKLMIEKELSAEPTWVGFGEIALLLNSKRTASIIANSEC